MVLSYYLSCLEKAYGWKKCIVVICIWEDKMILKKPWSARKYLTQLTFHLTFRYEKPNPSLSEAQQYLSTLMGQVHTRWGHKNAFFSFVHTFDRNNYGQWPLHSTTIFEWWDTIDSEEVMRVEGVRVTKPGPASQERPDTEAKAGRWRASEAAFPTVGHLLGTSRIWGTHRKGSTKRESHEEPSLSHSSKGK